MKIQKITSQSRRDFQAVYKCGKKSNENYKPLAPKYGEQEII